MKKIAKYIAFAFAGLVMASCGDSYDDWAQPQTNPEEDAITVPGFKASAAPAIDFASVTTDSVQTFVLGEAALPAGFTLEDARIELTPKNVDGATTTTVNTGVNGNVPAEQLSSLVVETYGKRPSARTFAGHVYVDAVKDGQAVLIDAGTVDVVMTPKAPHIEAGYYLTGDMTGAWDLSHLMAFAHSGADVYEDPVFTLMITTTADNQYWKIIPKSNVDSQNMWADGVLGVAVDGDASMSGRLVSDNPQAGKIEKAGVYMMTLNMMDYTYELKQIAPEYYLVGALQGWSSSDKTCKMYAETAMKHTYTTKWTGDANLKIWLGSDFGTWDKCFGAASDGSDAVSGSLVSTGAGAVVCPEKGAYYTFTADFSTMTYTWTKLASQTPTEYTNVGLIGVGGDWNNDVDMTQVTPHNWYVEVNIPEGGLKIRANHEWGNGNWGLASGQSYESNGTLLNDGGSGNIPVPAGKYHVYFNDITAQYSFVAI